MISKSVLIATSGIASTQGFAALFGSADAGTCCALSAPART